MAESDTDRIFESPTESDVDNGLLRADYTSTLRLGDVGSVEVELRVTEDFVTPEQAEARLTPLQGNNSRLVVPVYVVPGVVNVRLTALEGATLVEAGEPVRSADRRIRVDRGIPGTAAWAFELTRCCDASLVVVAEQVLEADPDFRRPASEISVLDIDSAVVRLPLSVPSDTPSSRATSNGDGGGSAGGGGWLGTSWAVVTASAAALGVTVVFLLWLVGTELARRERAPRVTTVLLYLPNRLAEFKNNKGDRI